MKAPKHYIIPKVDADEENLVKIQFYGDRIAMGDIATKDPSSYRIIEETLHDLQVYIPLQDFWPEGQQMSAFFHDRFEPAAKSLMAREDCGLVEKVRLQVRLAHYRGSRNPLYHLYMNQLVSISWLLASV